MAKKQFKRTLKYHVVRQSNVFDKNKNKKKVPLQMKPHIFEIQKMGI